MSAAREKFLGKDSAQEIGTSGLMRTVALICQERTSKIMLNGVSVARRKRLKPASVAT
jgi:hypothetical protein